MPSVVTEGIQQLPAQRTRDSQRRTRVLISGPWLTLRSPRPWFYLQRSAHTAWAELEQHRKDVQALREKDSPEKDRELPAWMSRALRPWTEEEDAWHLEMRTAALAAQEALLQGFADAGLKRDAATVAQLQVQARAAAGDA